MHPTRFLTFGCLAGLALCAAPAGDPPPSDSRLMGSWGGYSSDNGKSASFRVLSVNGNEAEVSVTTDGITRQGTGIVYKNVIMFGQSQIATDDGQNGKIIYQV